MYFLKLSITVISYNKRKLKSDIKKLLRKFKVLFNLTFLWYDTDWGKWKSNHHPNCSKLSEHFFWFQALILPLLSKPDVMVFATALKAKSMFCFNAVFHIAFFKALVLCNKRHSGYLTTFYLCLKAVYVVNIFFHILFLNWLLGYDFNYYGWQASRTYIIPTKIIKVW